MGEADCVDRAVLLQGIGQVGGGFWHETGRDDAWDVPAAGCGSPSLMRVEDAVKKKYPMLGRGSRGWTSRWSRSWTRSTPLHFRHLLEEHHGEKHLAAQNEVFDANGRIMRGGSIVDANGSTLHRRRRRTPTGTWTRRCTKRGEAEPVVPRDEGLHRGGRRDLVCPRRDGDRSERSARTSTRQ